MFVPDIHTLGCNGDLPRIDIMPAFRPYGLWAGRAAQIGRVVMRRPNYFHFKVGSAWDIGSACLCGPLGFTLAWS